MRDREWEFELKWTVETPKHKSLRISLIPQYEYLYNAYIEDKSNI